MFIFNGVLHKRLRVIDLRFIDFQCEQFLVTCINLHLQQPALKLSATTDVGSRIIFSQDEINVVSSRDAARPRRVSLNTGVKRAPQLCGF